MQLLKEVSQIKTIYDLLALCCSYIFIETQKNPYDFQTFDDSKTIDLELVVNENYGLREFCQNVSNDIENRCQNYCYRVRMEETARYAKENGFDSFTTTLLVSPYQKHEEIKAVCREMEEKYGVAFLYRDFRVGFREGQAKARELGLYMQKYCGCIFSESDRYAKQIKRDRENLNFYARKSDAFK